MRRRGDIGGGGTAGQAAATTRMSHRDHLESPTELFKGANERTDVYKITDDVTDEQFEEAITEAKDEGNLSRANVVRKVGKTARKDQSKAVLIARPLKPAEARIRRLSRADVPPQMPARSGLARA